MSGPLDSALCNNYPSITNFRYNEQFWGSLWIPLYLFSDPSGIDFSIYLLSTRRRMPVHTRAVMDFNFGSAPHLSDHCQITINLKNTGSATAEW